MVNLWNIAATAGAAVVRSGEGQTLGSEPQGTIRIIAGARTTDGSFGQIRTLAS
jgi:hypothetical protein